MVHYQAFRWQHSQLLSHAGEIQTELVDPPCLRGEEKKENDLMASSCLPFSGWFQSAHRMLTPLLSACVKWQTLGKPDLSFPVLVLHTGPHFLYLVLHMVLHTGKPVTSHLNTGAAGLLHAKDWPSFWGSRENQCYKRHHGITALLYSPLSKWGSLDVWTW